MIDGIINVYKEQGFTSHDVVAKLRGILHQKKIGHTGTLDPDAVGVLPVCLGKGTKLSDMLTDRDKTYEAVMTLGKSTDTQDISGKVLEENNVVCSKREIVEAIKSFAGDYDQIPPMYSALKVNGKKLYELARAGIEIERKPRRVTIKSIHINEIELDYDEKTVTFTVVCSKGTYIRTLCDDIGKKLGCGACMKSLKRTRVGQFDIDSSLTLNQIAALVLKGELAQYIIPVDEMFHSYKKVVVLHEFDKLIYNGNKFSQDHIRIEESKEFNEADHVRVYDEDGRFIGVYTFNGEMFVPVKMFYSVEEE